MGRRQDSSREGPVWQALSGHKQSNTLAVELPPQARGPISVDGVFMFKGQIEKWENPKVDEPAPIEAEPKKKVKKKTAGD